VFNFESMFTKDATALPQYALPVRLKIDLSRPQTNPTRLSLSCEPLSLPDDSATVTNAARPFLKSTLLFKIHI